MNILDTNALYKLVLYPDILEEGVEHLLAFKKKFGRLYTYEACLGECLNVFKRKAGKEKIITPKGHAVIGNRLVCFTKKNHSIKILSYRFQTPAYQNTALDLMSKFAHKIDFIDAYNIAVTFHRFPKAKFISADKKCVVVAKTMSIDTWYCMKAYEEPA